MCLYLYYICIIYSYNKLFKVTVQFFSFICVFFLCVLIQMWDDDDKMMICVFLIASKQISREIEKENSLKAARCALIFIYFLF